MGKGPSRCRPISYPSALDKIRQIRSLIGDRPIEIEVDGGINADNAKAVVDAGASVLVAGSAVFNKPDYGDAIRAIRDVGN